MWKEKCQQKLTWKWKEKSLLLKQCEVWNNNLKKKWRKVIGWRKEYWSWWWHKVLSSSIWSITFDILKYDIQWSNILMPATILLPSLSPRQLYHNCVLCLLYLPSPVVSLPHHLDGMPWFQYSCTFTMEHWLLSFEPRFSKMFSMIPCSGAETWKKPKGRCCYHCKSFHFSFQTQKASNYRNLAYISQTERTQDEDFQALHCPVTSLYELTELALYLMLTNPSFWCFGTSTSMQRPAFGDQLK